MFHVQITAIHALGKFRGCLMLKDASEENANIVIDEMTANLNGLQKLALVASDGSTICLNKQILQEAVLVFDVLEFN